MENFSFFAVQEKIKENEKNYSEQEITFLCRKYKIVLLFTREIFSPNFAENYEWNENCCMNGNC